jgi:hypothetical protein
VRVPLPQDHIDLVIERSNGPMKRQSCPHAPDIIDDDDDDDADLLFLVHPQFHRPADFGASINHVYTALSDSPSLDSPLPHLFIAPLSKCRHRYDYSGQICSPYRGRRPEAAMKPFFIPPRGVCPRRSPQPCPDGSGAGICERRGQQ